VLREPGFEIGARLERARTGLEVAGAFGHAMEALRFPLRVPLPGHHHLLLDPRRTRPLRTHRAPSPMSLSRRNTPIRLIYGSLGDILRRQCSCNPLWTGGLGM